MLQGIGAPCRHLLELLPQKMMLSAIKNIVFPFTMRAGYDIINSLKSNYFRRYFMAHVISDECIMCGACAAVCPVSAISEGDGKYVVDPDVCIDCGACDDGCPTGAIKAE